ncbi:MAG: prepilin-type N-terminal cleavage/methylation domain-containing protein [SAR324 cluster bacterium]|jgi:prepilin-type N-terminal cleavage/methylation domain-containing protein|nr:prepilin-type N-terminal cleavage/methylation domain-containing protein [SAR324 cluster bacterium]|tara:strand:+ start:5329 stop:5754 length:426 start_codon:yes stop_codon:yes gene_type:complete
MKNGYTFCIISRMKRFRRGFSLLEVMIVVVIIGILATLAYPSLEGYLQRSKQTEAKVGLSAVYTAQKIYFAINQTYADSLSNLDVQLETGGSSRYSITLTGSSSSFTATAKGNLDDDAVLDIWTIDQNKTLQNTVSDITSE